MAGEENTTQQNQQVDALAVIAQLLSGGGTGGVTAGSVYLGPGTGTKSVSMKRTGQTISVPTSDIVSLAEANKKYLTDPKLQNAWRKTMQKNGLETGNPVLERQAWEVAVAGASDWYSTSGGAAKVTPEQYLSWWAGGKKKKPSLPTRQIYQKTPEQIDADINELSQRVLGRTITDADKQADWYLDLTKGINKMLGKGIVTEVKEVKNKKTGKMEKQVIQTPGVSTEAISERITGALEAADPMSLERTKNLEFANWAFQKMGGRR